MYEFDYARLKAERMAAGKTAEECGKNIGLSKNAYYKKENGTNNMTVSEFSGTLAFLGIPESDIAKFFKQKVDKRER